uniref:LRRCT domain-containing protein n=1 Tax=Branchiostoma floridae TaxID=7739 RepID=C3XWM7_BRAFL|eukprot:XP_002611127.1 hypothetical protein BRAFLDRAFT_88474 [Branchiostoma floridae]
MGRKLRHLLIFLLIILKEPNLQVDGSSCTPSSARKASRICAPPRCDCRYMKLTSINVDLPASFTDLDLGDNGITMIQKGAFSNLTGLRELRLSSNKITIIRKGAFENLPGLRELRLSSNKITIIQKGAFTNLPQLQKLFLSENKITMIQAGSFANLPQLQHLGLPYNQITKIQEGTFVNVPRLQLLSLSANRITNIEEDVVPHLPGPEPQQLYMCCNQITMVQTDILLNGNPWQCDCKMAPFRLDSTEFPSFKDQIICVEPANLRGQKLTDVSPEDLRPYRGRTEAVQRPYRGRTEAVQRPYRGRFSTEQGKARLFPG